MTTITRPHAITVTVDHGTYSIYVDAQGWPVEPCRRCDGTGHYSFNGYDSVCYLCGNRAPWHRVALGAGTVAQAQADHCATLRRREADQARRDAARERKAAAALAAIWAARDALAPAFADYPLAVDATYYDNFIAADVPVATVRGYAFLADRWGQGRELSPKTLAIASETTARALADAGLAPLAEGRQTLAGVVVSVKPVDTDYGTTLKAVVRLDSGHRVYGALARSISEAQVGDRVEFAAAVQPTDDPAFAWFSRPTKARVVAA